MIDHTTLFVSDYEKSKDFYLKALEPFGFTRVMEFGQSGGFGTNNHPYIWLSQKDQIIPYHIAITAPDRASVDKFYKAAMAAGAKDNGAPGLRKDYHPNYYAAFVLDPDGYNLEAVCHKAE